MHEFVPADATTAKKQETEKSSGGFRRALTKIAVYSSITAAAMTAILSMDKGKPETRSRISSDDLLDMIRSDIGEMTYRKFSLEQEDVREIQDPDIQPMVMVEKLIHRLSSQNTDELCSTMQASFDFVSTYRMSDRSASQSGEADMDCNDYANIACERLSRRGIPMHLISIWPSDPEERMSHDWHQMAACRVGKKEFLVFDNGRLLIHWTGTLEEFARHYHEILKTDTPMSLIPHVGISRYVPPTFDCPPAKFLVQLKHTVGAGTMMQSLNVSPEYDSVAHLD